MIHFFLGAIMLQQAPPTPGGDVATESTNFLLLYFFGGIALLVLYAIAYVIKKETSGRQEKKQAASALVEILYKILLEATYLKRQGASVSWLYSYIDQHKKGFLDGTQGSLGHQRVAYKEFIRQIKEFIHDNDKTHLQVIYKLAREIVPDWTGIQAISTGYSSTQHFLRAHQFSPRITENDIKEGVMYRVNIEEADSFLEVYYIPEIHLLSKGFFRIDDFQGPVR